MMRQQVCGNLLPLPRRLLALAAIFSCQVLSLCEAATAASISAAAAVGAATSDDGLGERSTRSPSPGAGGVANTSLGDRGNRQVDGGSGYWQEITVGVTSLLTSTMCDVLAYKNVRNTIGTSTAHTTTTYGSSIFQSVVVDVHVVVLVALLYV